MGTGTLEICVLKHWILPMQEQDGLAPHPLPFNERSVLWRGSFNFLPNEPIWIKILRWNSSLRKILLIITLGYCFIYITLKVLGQFFIENPWKKCNLHRQNYLDERVLGKHLDAKKRLETYKFLTKRWRFLNGSWGFRGLSIDRFFLIRFAILRVL